MLEVRWEPVFTVLNKSLTPVSHAHKLPIEYHDVYPCPVCRHGEVSAIILTDAFACNFCRHIFTCTPEEGVMRVEDSSQPLSWRWNGKAWNSLRHEDLDLTLVIWGVGLAVVILPPTLVFFSCWSLWANPHTSPLTFLWTIITFLAHFFLISWMLAEHYQMAPYVSGKVHLREWLEQRRRS
ncbi:hypothetical protein [Anthocerotibacter panamensis]|uniref:hypothetical protein n=1 Tax=Anthocerotibacter panamensis TaxID=2857077 RepID=UPI001C407555|nr:hypothetical protein [Anthocerotibacter panamensis]